MLRRRVGTAHAYAPLEEADLGDKEFYETRPPPRCLVVDVCKLVRVGVKVEQLVLVRRLEGRLLPKWVVHAKLEVSRGATKQQANVSVRPVVIPTALPSDEEPAFAHAFAN